MPATLHWILGSPGTDWTSCLLDGYPILDGGPALLLVPSERHAGAMRESSFANPSHCVTLGISHFTEEILRANDSDVPTLSDPQRRLVLDAVLSEMREAGQLGPFDAIANTAGFARDALGTIAELDVARTDSRPSKLGGRSKDSTPDSLAISLRIFERYRHKLMKLNRLDSADRLRRAAELWNAGRTEPFAGIRSAGIMGFTSFPPAQVNLWEALRNTLEHVRIGLPDEAGEERAETFAVSRRTRLEISGNGSRSSLFDVPLQVETEHRAAADTRPAGLQHLSRTLFRVTAATPSSDAGGLQMIEAPGPVGEARLVARAIRRILATGVPPERISIVARRWETADLELLREVFDEYEVPHGLAAGDTLNRVPAVAFLLRAWRLPENDWPFAEVSAVLRSTYFRPSWPEMVRDPEVASTAEALLRMLGEPRSREAYLAAVRLWETTPPAALEDESAEEPRRQKIQRLAGRCRAFLERFFQTWDRFQPRGNALSFVTSLKAFAVDIGLADAIGQDTADTEGMDRFWQELDRWSRNDFALLFSRKTLDSAHFARILTALAAVPFRTRALSRPGAVQLLAADEAAGLPCEVLFLMGLDEGSWPRLGGPESLLGDGDRARLRHAGFSFPVAEDRLGAEQLLFLQLVSQPRQQLILSYAAVDEQGQSLLPSTFLREALACFGPSVIPTTRKRMLIEGYFTEEAMSAAEQRVQAARKYNERVDGGSLRNLARNHASDLVDNLAAAHRMAQARFHNRQFGPHDGLLRHPAVLTNLTSRFTPQRVFSPTSLETYVACPFRFWLQHVLRLDSLENPVEEVEHTRRGSAFHRALSRLHLWINETMSERLGDHEVPETVQEELLTQIDKAVEEYASRAPSPATRELWRLEGQRLKRSAAKYRGHWHTFREPWQKNNATPKPFRFEADFSKEPLVLEVAGIEVRIGGVIDRVDVAELGGSLGFWIIDYKTGKASSYSATQVGQFEKLQLPLYAMAVERVLIKDRPARPLGMAYWLVTDTGPKPMLPAGKRQVMQWFADPELWPKFRSQLEAWVHELVQHIRAGDFPLSPRSEHCTDTCDFGPVCRISQGRATGKRFPLALPVAAAS